jgi:hypothetical protein
LLKSTLHDTTDPMKLFLLHTVVFVGSIWKNKSGWFLFVMSLELSLATENVLDFQPKFCSKSTLHDTTDPMKLFLFKTHMVVFVGSIWKNKSGWLLFVMFLCSYAYCFWWPLKSCWKMWSIITGLSSYQEVFFHMTLIITLLINSCFSMAHGDFIHVVCCVFYSLQGPLTEN